MEMEKIFGPGDMAVYPAQGVAEVIGIEEKEISGKATRFFVLRIVDTDMRIMVPVVKAKEVGLRQIISEEEILEVFEILREKEIHVDKQTWNRRYRGFMEKIKTGSLFEVAEVYRDLFRLKSTKTLSFGERRMLDTAKNLIVKELSVARKMNETKMEHELEQIFLA
jgi:CarD family transcriptional regulator